MKMHGLLQADIQLEQRDTLPTDWQWNDAGRVFHYVPKNSVAYWDGENFIFFNGGSGDFLFQVYAETDPPHWHIAVLKEKDAEALVRGDIDFKIVTTSFTSDGSETHDLTITMDRPSATLAVSGISNDSDHQHKADVINKGPSKLENLRDVSLEGQTQGDVLTWDQTENSWVNKPLPTTTTFTRTDALAVVTGIARFYPLRDCSLEAFTAWVGVAPLGGDITFDLKKNGVVVASGMIAEGLFVMPKQSDLFIQVLTTDYLTLDITAVGTTVPGSELRLRAEFN